GEVLVGDPAVASWGDSRLDVLVNTRSGKVAHWWWDHGWGGQNIWAGPSSSTPLLTTGYAGPAIAAPIGPGYLWSLYLVDLGQSAQTTITPYPLAGIWDNGQWITNLTGGYHVKGMAVCASKSPS